MHGVVPEELTMALLTMALLTMSLLILWLYYGSTNTMALHYGSTMALLWLYYMAQLRLCYGSTYYVVPCRLPAVLTADAPLASKVTTARPPG
eukprot:scaffold21899_cov63-Phaeocystis_antarctica.AAC.1